MSLGPIALIQFRHSIHEAISRYNISCSYPVVIVVMDTIEFQDILW
jgi:hypothetical protein